MDRWWSRGLIGTRRVSWRGLADWPVWQVSKWVGESNATRSRGELLTSIRWRNGGARNSDVKMRTIFEKLARSETVCTQRRNNEGTTVEVVAGWILAPPRRKCRISRFRAAKLQAGRGGMNGGGNGGWRSQCFVTAGTNVRGTGHGDARYRRTARCGRQANQSSQKFRYPPPEATGQ